MKAEDGNQKSEVQVFGLFPTARFTQDTKNAKNIYQMEDIEKIASTIVHSAIKVHKAMGPGLLESVYQKCLEYELKQSNMAVQSEVPIPVKYRKVEMDVGFRIDMLVSNQIIIENKTVEKIAPIHEAQLLTYLKMTNLKLGFILNWNVILMKNGIKRMVNNLQQ